MMEWLLKGAGKSLYNAIRFVAGQFKEFAETALLAILNLLPQAWKAALPGELAETFRCAQMWFPLAEIAAMMAIYYTFVAAFTIYRFAKSWIPGLSG